MKLMEFHLQSLGGCIMQIMDAREEIKKPTQQIFHVREVREIDWDKAWQDYWEKGGVASREEIKEIQQLVEAQLKGEE